MDAGKYEYFVMFKDADAADAACTSIQTDLKHDRDVVSQLKKLGVSPGSTSDGSPWSAAVLFLSPFDPSRPRPDRPPMEVNGRLMANTLCPVRFLP